MARRRQKADRRSPETAKGDRIGLKLTERDGTIFSYPVLVRKVPESAAVRVDKTLVFTLRPNILAAFLKKLQGRENRARPEKFLESVFFAYELAREHIESRASVDIPLTEIYDILTLLPGSEREYTLLDFTRDLYFLDISGVTQTRSGATISLPDAS